MCEFKNRRHICLQKIKNEQRTEIYQKFQDFLYFKSNINFWSPFDSATKTFKSIVYNIID